jgi:integrase
MQAPLFDLPARSRSLVRRVSGKLDAGSEALLEQYRQSRLVAGATPATVVREVSQLRSLARSVAGTQAAALRTLFSEASTVARALLEPSAPIAASTGGRTRLVAAQRFVHTCGAEVGIADPATFLNALDEQLPRRVVQRWNAAGTIVAGVNVRRRSLCPTLYPSDLDRILASVALSPGYRGMRDRALVALHCYSGLRPDEIMHLQGANVQADSAAHLAVVVVRRDGRVLRLLVPAAGAEPLLLLTRHDTEVGRRPDVYVFRRSGAADKPLTSRAIRAIVQRACRHAGFPTASAADLRAAFAYWLRLQGFSDHETAAVLGLAHVRTLDRLLARHEALDAQRRVREMMPM